MIISSQRTKKAILIALADEDMTKILNSVTAQSKSINSIIREQNIPYTTTYRKVKWLLNQSLLVVDRYEISPEGKKSSFVQSTLRSITVKYENAGVIIIEAEENVYAIKKVMRKFFSME